MGRLLFRDAARLFAGVSVAKGLDFVLTLLLARSLGVEGFGRYTYALSFTLLFGALGDLGLSTVFTREVARDPRRARALLGPCLAIKAILAIGTIGVLVLIARGGARSDAGSLMTPIAIGMVLLSVALLFDGLLRAAGRAGMSGLASVAQGVTALVAGAALLGIGLGPRAGALAYLAGAAFRLGTSAWASRDLWRGTALRNPSWSEPWRLVRESLPLALSSVFVVIYFRIDAVILHAFQGVRAVGLYAGIYRIFEVFALLAVTLRSVLFPIMARAADGPREALAVLCRRSIRVHLLFTIGVAVFFSFHRELIARAALGPAYAEAAPALAILIWALPGSYMADTLMFLLTARRRQALGTWAVAATAVFNVGLNLVLVPRISYLGASIATVASEWLCCALLLALFVREVPMPGLERLLWRPALAGGLFALVLLALSFWAPVGLPGLAAVALVAVAVYGAALTLVGAIERDDWTRFKAWTSRARGEGSPA